MKFINMDLLAVFFNNLSFPAEYAVEPVMAFVWFIPVLIGAAIVTTSVIIANTGTSTVQGKSIGILGMQEAGKTSLLNILRRREYGVYEATAIANYNAFSCEINGKTYSIKAGVEIGGDERFIPRFYEEFLNTRDICFFIFNVKKYLYNTQYKNETNARLEYVHRHLKSKYTTDGVIHKHLVVIGSHIDTLSESQQKDALKRCQNTIEGKNYSMMFDQNFLLMDLTKPGAVLRKFADTNIFG